MLGSSNNSPLTKYFSAVQPLFTLGECQICREPNHWKNYVKELGLTAAHIPDKTFNPKSRGFQSSRPPRKKKKKSRK